jgi:hypothetical protein
LQQKWKEFSPQEFRNPYSNFVKLSIKSKTHLMYENGNIRSFETIPGGGRIKENDGGGEFNDDILKELLEMSQCTPSMTII